MTITISVNAILIIIGILSIWIIPIIYGENDCKGLCVPIMSMTTIPIVWFVLLMIAYFLK